MSAKQLYHSKITLIHRRADIVAIAELKVWQVPKSEHFPEGIKYSLFLIGKATGEVIIGYDNHRPKGHHMHEGAKERAYMFRNVEELVAAFWSNVKAKGFLI